MWPKGETKHRALNQKKEMHLPCWVSSACQIVHTWTVSMLIREPIAFLSMLTLIGFPFYQHKAPFENERLERRIQGDGAVNYG